MSGVGTAQEIIERIRERLRARKQEASNSASPSQTDTPDAAFHDLSRLRQEIAACNATHAAVGTLNPRRGGPHNALIQLIKKVMRRSLTWYTRPLHQFHGSVTRSLNEVLAALQNMQSVLQNHGEILEEQRRSLQSYQGWQGEAFEKIYSRLGAVEETKGEAFEKLYSRLGAVEETTGQRLRSAERNMRRIMHSLEPRKRERPQSFPKPDGEALAASQAKAEYDFDYFLFEDRFRGSEADIKSRQRELYLNYFRGKQNVLDLGCGRGEFLELLRAENISCRGVESGLDAFLLCQEKGLDVTHQDLFPYLEAIPNESLGGIFSAQVIEHLPVELQFRMVKLSRSKLLPAAPLIIETINPECVSALVRNFYLDPTHARPVHPEMLKFVFESLAFQKVELRFSAPLSEQQIPHLDLPVPAEQLARINRSLAEVNQRLFGSQDYAIIGWK